MNLADFFRPAAVPAVPMAHTLRGLATLLAYPDADLRAALPSLRDWVAFDARVAEERPALLALLDTLDGQDATDALAAQLAAEEAYVETFDRGRATSLNLFEHVHGDGRDRGQAMVDLLTMYRDAGLDYGATELPDHLPAFLEFASTKDEADACRLLEEISHILAAVGAALERRESPWAPVLRVLLRLAGERAPDARLAAETVPDDLTPEAIEQAWAEEPVQFMGAQLQNACTPQTQTRREHEIHIVRKKS